MSREMMELIQIWSLDATPDIDAIVRPDLPWRQSALSDCCWNYCY